jgi:hypothetical protein
MLKNEEIYSYRMTDTFDEYVGKEGKDEINDVTQELMQRDINLDSIIEKNLKFFIELDYSGTYPAMRTQIRFIYLLRKKFSDKIQKAIDDTCRTLCSLDFDFPDVTSEDYERGEFHDNERDRYLEVTKKHLSTISDHLWISKLFKTFARFLYENHQYQAPATPDKKKAIGYMSKILSYFEEQIPEPAIDYRPYQEPPIMGLDTILVQET